MLEMAQILDRPGMAAGAEQEAPALLPCEVRGLCFNAGGKLLISDIDLKLSAGQVSIILGPNGAGKTLLVRLLHGMIEPTSGEIKWGGAPLGEAMRKRQAMVFQAPVLLRRSVKANIEFVLNLHDGPRRQKVEEILALAGLDDKASQPARLLSGGERQRLAVARALATDPDVLFLDEPTASLDPASTLAIENIVTRARMRGTKIIFITHDLGQARRLGDEIIFMHHGQVIEQASVTRFFQAPSSTQARDYLAGRIVL